MPLFLMGCFPVDFQEVKRPFRTKSVKRPIKVGKRPINEGKRPIKAKVLVGVSVGCLMGCFRAPPPWRKTAPLKRPIKRSMKICIKFAQMDQRNPRVRKIFARNSKDRNGLRQFYGRLFFFGGLFLQENLHAHKILILGVFWFFSWGGGVPILFLWARGFFRTELNPLKVPPKVPLKCPRDFLKSPQPFP